METWEDDESFREYVDAEREAGRLLQRDVDAMVGLPRRLEWKHARDPSARSAVERAYSLYRDSGAVSSPVNREVWQYWKLPDGPPETRGG